MSSSNQESHPPEREIRIRYKLVNAKDGTPYKGATPAAVFVRWPADVDLFRGEVHAKEIGILKEFAPCQLLVYGHGSSDEKTDVSPDPKNLLEPFSSLVEVGMDEKHAPLLVAVPSTESPTHSARTPLDVRSPEIGRSGLSSAESPTPQQISKKLRESAEAPRIPKTANPPFSSSRTVERDDAIGPSSKPAWTIFLDNLLNGSVADCQSTQHMEAGGFLKIRRPIATGNTRWTLWSEEVMHDVREVSGLSIPVDSVRDMLKINETVVLIGVGGCGKTQTCFDLCRTSDFHAAYLDWSLHGDLLRLAEIIHPPRLNPRSAMALNEAVTAELERILIVRLYALRYKKQSNPEYSPDQYFRLQQMYSGTFGVMCGEIPKHNLLALS